MTTTAAAAPLRQRKQKRNIGNNYALALQTGGDTHITLVYFNNVKRGFAQERVKQLAEQFLDDVAVFPARVTLQLGDMMTERCIAVVNPELVAIQRELTTLFTTLGYDLAPAVPLHIDLRGKSDSLVQRLVDTRRWLH